MDELLRLVGWVWSRMNWARRRDPLYTRIRGDIICYFMWFLKSI